MNLMNTEQQKYYGNTALGLTGGAAAFVWFPNIVTRKYVQHCQKQSKFSNNEYERIWHASKKALENSPIKDKVTLVDYNTSNWEPIADNIVNLRRNYLKKTKNPFIKILSATWPNDEEFKARIYAYAQGKNACYMPGTSQILVNKNKRANAVFHEIGHALNSKGSGFGKLLATHRGGFQKCVPFIFGISMLTPKDREDSGTKNPMYKSLLGFKKFSGIAASACLLPLVAEEGLASIKGAKLAKEVLSPELCKKINKTNAKAFSAYFLSMVVTGLGISLANYIKDKVTGPLPDTKLRK